MEETNKVPFDVSDARGALDQVTKTGRQSADEIAKAFDEAGAKIANALGRAALGGKTSFKDLTGSILAELARVAVTNVFDGKSGGSADKASQAVNVAFNFAAGSDAESVKRNQAQIAAQLARAVAYGQRNS